MKPHHLIRSIFYLLHVVTRFHKCCSPHQIECLNSPCHHHIVVVVVGVLNLRTHAAPLTAHLQPQVQTVDVDKDAQFQCIVSGHPVHDINWLHDGKPILRDNHIEVGFICYMCCVYVCVCVVKHTYERHDTTHFIVDVN